MLYIEIKYANIAGPRLDLFKISKSKPYVASAVCPFCEPQKKKKKKFYIYEWQEKNTLMCKCHKCGYSNSLINYLKSQEPFLYKDYRVEYLKATGNYVEPKKEIKIPKTKKFAIRKTIDDNFISILDLDDNHKCKEYVLSRKIPDKQFSELFYTSDFKQ
mgnify:FL=1